MSIPKQLLINWFTRKRTDGNADGRTVAYGYLAFRGYRDKKRRVVRTDTGEYIEAGSTIVPRVNGLDIKPGDRIFEGQLESGDDEPGINFEVIGKDTGDVPGTTKTHHEEIFLK